MKDRDLSLDVIRVLACMLVVLMHSPLPSANANGPFLAALSFFTAPCIGLFFMVSGALLLPVKMDYFTFLKRRMSKIVIPTLVWTAIYIGLNIYYSKSEINILHSIASIPFTAQGNGVLWFMYTLIGLYLLAPILSSWVVTAADKELKFVLLLWSITLFYPLLKYGVDLNQSTTGILYYFTGYAGYFLLGYALKSGRIRVPIVWPILIPIAGVVLLLAFNHFGIEYDFYSLFWYESIFIASMCYIIWRIVTKYAYSKIDLRPRTRNIIFEISNLSFGIYLMHILIMRYWLWNMEIIQTIPNYILQSFVIASVSFILTITGCYIVSKLPCSQWVIGYNSHKNKIG